MISIPYYEGEEQIIYNLIEALEDADRDIRDLYDEIRYLKDAISDLRYVTNDAR